MIHESLDDRWKERDNIIIDKTGGIYDTYETRILALLALSTGAYDQMNSDDSFCNLIPHILSGLYPGQPMVGNCPLSSASLYVRSP
jgi:hypothetical protein